MRRLAALAAGVAVVLLVGAWIHGTFLLDKGDVVRVRGVAADEKVYLVWRGDGGEEVVLEAFDVDVNSRC